jgi:5'-deoxynucleotidase
MFENEIMNFEIIERWGIVRMHRRGSVGAHSQRVAIYADQIATTLGLDPADRYAVIRYALWHDAAEVFTGDLPSPLKHHLIDPEALLDYETEELADRFPGGEWDDGLLSNAARSIVKLADLLDAALWLVVEKRMGNTLIGTVYDDVVRALHLAIEELPGSVEQRLAVSSAVTDALRHHAAQPMHRLVR